MWEIIKRVTLRYEINATKRSSSIVHLDSIHQKLLLFIQHRSLTKSSGIMHHDTIHSLAHMFLHIKSFFFQSLYNHLIFKHAIVFLKCIVNERVYIHEFREIAQ